MESMTEHVVHVPVLLMVVKREVIESIWLLAAYSSQPPTCNSREMFPPVMSACCDAGRPSILIL